MPTDHEQQIDVTEQLQGSFETGLLTGATLVGFAWLLVANWGPTGILISAIIAAVVALNVFVVVSRRRGRKRRLMALDQRQGNYIRLHLRD